MSRSWLILICLIVSPFVSCKPDDASPVVGHRQLVATPDGKQVLTWYISDRQAIKEILEAISDRFLGGPDGSEPRASISCVPYAILSRYAFADDSSGSGGVPAGAFRIYHPEDQEAVKAIVLGSAVWRGKISFEQVLKGGAEASAVLCGSNYSPKEPVECIDEPTPREQESPSPEIQVSFRGEIRTSETCRPSGCDCAAMGGHATRPPYPPGCFVPDPLGVACEGEDKAYKVILCDGSEWGAHECPAYEGDPWGGCFARGTRIRLADKSQRLVEDIRVGDRIWNPVLKRLARVKSLTLGPEEKTLVEIKTERDSLVVTAKHPMWTSVGVVAAETISEGSFVVGPSGTPERVLSVKSITARASGLVYNFDLDIEPSDPRQRLVEANGIATGDLTLQRRLAKRMKGLSRFKGELAAKRGETR